MEVSGLTLSQVVELFQGSPMPLKFQVEQGVVRVGFDNIGSLLVSQK
ncbi:hypothetical protein HY571_00760 [Candidatus Micrarchaeota archaeon]|nr:hypothetical protein [Candidatus Micrarchaeota archaeon]